MADPTEGWKAIFTGQPDITNAYGTRQSRRSCCLHTTVW